MYILFLRCWQWVSSIFRFGHKTNTFSRLCLSIWLNVKSVYLMANGNHLVSLGHAEFFIVIIIADPGY